MKISFTNISRIIKNIKTTNDATDSQVTDSGNANTSRSGTTERSLTQNINNNANFELLKLSIAQNALLIRELLDLPKDFKDFLALFVDKNASKESIAELLKNANLQIDMAEIKQLLDTNSKEVISKLIKLIQQDPLSSQNADQIKDILNALIKVLPQSKSQTQDTMKTLMLLYLPYLPLPYPLDIKLGIEEKSSAAGDDETESLVILITTLNFGRIKVSLIINSTNHLKIDIELQEGEEENDDLKEKILQKINDEITKLKVTPNTNFYLSATKSKNDDEKRSVSIQKVEKASPQLILSAYTVIKVIFEFDDNSSLLKQRKEMLDK